MRVQQLDLTSLSEKYPDIISPLLPFPEPFLGSGPIKAILLGADPTHIVENDPLPLKMVFNLNHEKSPYWRGIQKNIQMIAGLSRENVFVQNVCRNYFKVETSRNKEWVKIAREFWIPILKEELDSMFPAAVPILMTTEFILRAALKDKINLLKANNIYAECVSIQKEDNLFNRELLAFYRHPAYSLFNWPEYNQFVGEKLKLKTRKTK